MKSNAIRNAMLGIALTCAIAACRGDTGAAVGATGAIGQAADASGGTASLAAGAGASGSADPGFGLPDVGRSLGNGFARLPDRGDLVAYPAGKPVRREGAYTWHRADVSEAHAFRAIVDGILTITTPSGERLRFEYDRHVEHASGDWTWIGHLAGGTVAEDAILTFGPHAVVGTIAEPGGGKLALAMRDGQSWLVETDYALLAKQSRAAGRYDQPDYLVPPPSRPGSAGGSTTRFEAAAPRMQPAAATTVVDVLIGYTTGFDAADRSGPGGNISTAETRLNSIVAIANESYVNSGLDIEIRLVHTMMVDYPDATDNSDALMALTGTDGQNAIAVPAALQPLRAARDQYGADLVTLVRQFTHPENTSCGVAWLIGVAQQPTSVSDEWLGYSVVSDGSSGGFFCEATTYAHELGHNMGLQHDIDTAKGENGVLDEDEYGRFPYSFGYRTSPGQGDFYTVMAYNEDQANQYRVFSNPRIAVCGGHLCGIANQADNARTLEQTVPIIAAFRSTAVQDQTAPDLYTIARQGGSGRTELHVLDGEASYGSFSQHVSTALFQTGSDDRWAFLIGDYDKDGVNDLYSIYKMGSTGQTEVHVLDGASGFSRFSAHFATALHATGDDKRWQFKLGDFNRDGSLDVYAINREGGSGRTEVHVLNGADGYQSFLAHVGTALYATGTGQEWAFAVGDYNRDEIADLFVIYKSGTSGTTEVHILDGATQFQSFLLHIATALHQTPADNSWEFKLGDYDRDGLLDVYAIAKNGGSGTTELHILGGAARYTSFIAHRATALHSTGSDESWEFELGPDG